MGQESPRPVVLCADDYALAPGVSRAILDLISRGRLSATSCMTGSRFWPEHGPWLAPLREHADIGLHFTLTGGQPPLGPMPHTAPEGRLPPLGWLLRAALARRLDAAEVRAELGRQFDAFVAVHGAPPDFIDGHQHVHQLPVVRDAVLDLVEARCDRRRIYVRCCWEPPLAILRRGVSPLRTVVIGLLGWRMRGLLARRGIPANDGFRGVHDFTGRVPYTALFPRYLEGLGDRALVHCHPGVIDDALRAIDPVTDTREEEYRYFASDAFAAALDRAGLELARFGASPGTAGRTAANA